MSTPTETTPDQLLESFRGRSFKSIILFTVIIHIVVIGGSSIPYFIKSMSSKADPKLSEQERLDRATREATSVLRDIASKHGLQPQELSARIAGDSPAAAKPKTIAPTPTEEQKPAAPTEEEEKPKPAIEEELEVKKEGPAVPPIPTEEAEDDDLFR